MGWMGSNYLKICTNNLQTTWLCLVWTCGRWLSFVYLWWPYPASLDGYLKHASTMNSSHHHFYKDGSKVCDMWNISKISTLRKVFFDNSLIYHKNFKTIVSLEQNLAFRVMLEKELFAWICKSIIIHFSHHLTMLILLRHTPTISTSTLPFTLKNQLDWLCRIGSSKSQLGWRSHTPHGNQHRLVY